MSNRHLNRWRFPSTPFLQFQLTISHLWLLFITAVPIVGARNYGNYTRNLDVPSINIETDKRVSLGSENWPSCLSAGIIGAMRREKEGPSDRWPSRFFSRVGERLIRATRSIDERGASDAHCPVRRARTARRTNGRAMDGRIHPVVDNYNESYTIRQSRDSCSVMLEHVSSATVPSLRSSDSCSRCLHRANRCRPLWAWMIDTSCQWGP